MRPNTWDQILDALCSGTGYLTLNIWYSTLYAIQFLLPNSATQYWIHHIWFLNIWYLDTCSPNLWYMLPITCQMLIDVLYFASYACYLILDIWYLQKKLSDSFYMLLKLAITYKGIVSFRSCSATRFCLFGVLVILNNEAWHSFDLFVI